MSRQRKRIDYMKLHSTGERNIKDQSTENTSTENKATAISNQITSDQADTSNLEDTFASYQTLLQDDTVQDDQLNVQCLESVSVANLSSLIQGLSLQEPSTMDKNRLNHLNIEQGVITSDVDDLLMENDIEEMTKQEVETLTIKVEALRTRFRTIHAELLIMLSDDYEQQFLKLHEKTLSVIKDIVRRLKSRLKYLRIEEETKRNQHQHMSINSQRFLLKELMYAIQPLHAVFSQHPTDFSFDADPVSRNTARHQEVHDIRCARC